MRLRFRCGHEAEIDADRVQSPVCPACGDRQVARVLDAPTPSFRGHCSGPYAERAHLGPLAVSLADRPLSLKVH